jgi:putative DNA methylase
MAKAKGKSKKELLTEQISSAVGAGRQVAVETVDFSDPNRPKTCLEVDFPIIPINQIAAIEGKGSGALKPIYQVSKWWARRRSTVFRAMLLAAVTRAPEDESKAAKAVWEVYYADHQKCGSLRHLKVADPFMGGGTTVVEGSRMGLQLFGCDLNPVAWFVVKNEMAEMDVGEVKRLLADVEAEVKPQIMPFFACDGPKGVKGKWFRLNGTKKRAEPLVQGSLLQANTPGMLGSENDWDELPTNFDIFSVPWQERQFYRYEGPEIIYTFWAKHGPCQREGCGHRTPILSTPVVAIKTLTVDAWADHKCSKCDKTFDVERCDSRMAPDAALFVASDEKPFSVMDERGRFACPHCGKTTQNERAFATGDSLDFGRAKSKKVQLTLLVHPQWMKGSPKNDENGREYGGSPSDSIESTARWLKRRTEDLRLLEVRGNLPEAVTCPETGLTFYTDRRGGTMPKKSTFTCAIDGTPNDVLDAIKQSGKAGPIAPYAFQGFDPSGANGDKFFATAGNLPQLEAVIREWDLRKNGDLKGFWPISEVPYGFMTGIANGDIRTGHGFTHWWKMFSPRQMLVHALLLKAIVTNPHATQKTKFAVLGVFQQYLRNNNLFCFWNIQRALEPMFSNNNYHPKSTMIESSVFPGIARGDFAACAQKLLEAIEWCQEPWDIVAFDNDGHSDKVPMSDKVNHAAEVQCLSATDLGVLAEASQDLVITDPPFGGLLHYSELADFFYVWLRLALKDTYPDFFTPEYTPKALEAVANEARHLDDADAFYQRVLTDCWLEVYRVLKPGGILAFTFHHSEDEPWVGVLESLFDAGFYLEATYPIRSDETKGEGEFGSKQIEYDIIHVCRKRMVEPQSISWARLRRLVVDDVRQLKLLLEQHRSAGLPAADLDIIKRGKALEYFSRHYGKVFIERDRPFTIREALPAIKLLVDEEADATSGIEAPPANAEPYTRQFFRMFYETTQVPRDQMQKFLRGTGTAPSDFTERGWCSEKNKVFTLTPPIELARGWKGASRKGMARDFDQTMFLVGGCFEGSNIRIIDTLDSPNFAPHPATAELVDWLISHGGSPQIKIAAQRAQTIYRDWLGKNKARAQEQLSLFDLES